MEAKQGRSNLGRKAVGAAVGAAAGMVLGFVLAMVTLAYTGWRRQGEPGEVTLGPLVLGTVEATADGTTTEVGAALLVVGLVLVVAGGIAGWAWPRTSQPAPPTSV